MNLLNTVEFSRRFLSSKPNTAVPTSEPELDANITTVSIQSDLPTNIIEDNPTCFPESHKLGYSTEDELQNGKRIYRCVYSMCAYYSETKNNVTRHYIRKHFYRCRYPKCSFSAAHENDYIKLLWTHNSSYASTTPTDSQTCS